MISITLNRLDTVSVRQSYILRHLLSQIFYLFFFASVRKQNHSGLRPCGQI